MEVKVKGKKTTDQCRIANEYGDMIIEKIKNLTKELPDKKSSAMKIYEKMITKVEENMVFTEVTYREVYKILSKTKNSKSRGDNELCSAFLKEIPQFTTLAIVHLFNCIVRTGVFLDEFKLSRIIALKKKMKDSSL